MICENYYLIINLFTKTVKWYEVLYERIVNIAIYCCFVVWIWFNLISFHFFWLCCFLHFNLIHFCTHDFYRYVSFCFYFFLLFLARYVKFYIYLTNLEHYLMMVSNHLLKLQVLLVVAMVMVMFMFMFMFMLVWGVVAENLLTLQY